MILVMEWDSVPSQGRIPLEVLQSPNYSIISHPASLYQFHRSDIGFLQVIPTNDIVQLCHHHLHRALPPLRRETQPVKGAMVEIQAVEIGM